MCICLSLYHTHKHDVSLIYFYVFIIAISFAQHTHTISVRLFVGWQKKMKCLNGKSILSMRDEGGDGSVSASCGMMMKKPSKHYEFYAQSLQILGVVSMCANQ